MPLQDSDNLIIGRGTNSYKISYQELKDDINFVPGSIDTPSVESPKDNAGSGDVRYLKSDKIQSVQEKSFDATYTGSFNPSYPAGNGFNRTEDKVAFPNGGAQLVDPNNEATSTSRVIANSTGTITLSTDIEISGSSSVYILYQSENYYSESDLNLIPRVIVYGRNGQHTVYNEYTTVDGQWGNFYQWAEIPNTVGNVYKIEIISTEGIAGMGQFKVDGVNIVEGVYETVLTVAGDTDLADLTGAVFMTDGTGAPGPYTQTPYKLVTSQITNVDNADPDSIVLTFADPCPDLQYFKVDDIVQSNVDETNVVAGDTCEVRISGFGDDQIDITWAEATFAETLTLFNQQAGGDSTSYPGNAIPTSFLYKFTKPVYGLEFMGEDETLDSTVDKVVYGSSDGANWVETSRGKILYGPNSTAKGEVVMGLTPYRFWKVSCIEPGGNAGQLLYYYFGWKERNQKVQIKAIAPPDVANRKLTVDGGEWRIGGGAETPTGYTVRKSSSIDDPPDLTWNTIGNTGQETILFTASDKYPTDAATYGTFIYDLGVTTSDVYWHHKTDNSGITDTHKLYTSSDGSTWTLADQGDGVKTRLFSGSDTFQYLLAVRTDFAGMSATNWSIDPSSFDGQDHVEYQTDGGKGTIATVDEATRTITLTSSTNRDERWIADNQAGIDFAVAGPALVDEPLLTADVELESSLFATTPAYADTLKNIIWELNGTTQNAGTANPYKPTGLATNTEYTVRVKHQGNSLNDSEWSTSTKFTTGATRNLYTYYKERVELLESRLASIEADEINDDATDTALLTLLANLATRIQNLEESN